MNELCTRLINFAREGNADEVVRLSRLNPFIPMSASIEPALFAGCELGQLAVVRACVLDLKCNPNCVDKSGRSPLHMAVTRRSNGKIAISIIKFLVENGAKIRKSVLHVCCNDLAVFPLVELGADINAPSVDGLTPIDVAVMADRQEVVSELIRAGCRLDERLIFSAKSGQIVRDLIRNGIDVNARDSSGFTPLHYAVESGNKALARALLECKADPSLVSSAVSSSNTTSSTPVEPIEKLTMRDVLSQLKATHATLMALRENNYKELFSFSNSDAEYSVLENLATATAKIANELREKCTDIQPHNLCTICRSGTKSVVLMPCRHFCVCFSCSKALKSGGSWDATSSDLKTSGDKPCCPICRAQINDFVTVYT
jgi:ankyrin repeat protein